MLFLSLDHLILVVNFNTAPSASLWIAPQPNADVQICKVHPIIVCGSERLTNAVFATTFGVMFHERFQWSGNDYNLKTVVDLFSARLPFFARTTCGYMGHDDALHEIGSNEVRETLHRKTRRI